jgi:anti-sigma factor RsiW
MNCRRAQKLLSVLHDGRLDDARRKAVERHLERCESCRAFADRLTSLEQRLQQWVVPDPRPGFTARTLARLPDVASKRGWFDRLTQLIEPTPIALGAASLALGVFLAVSMNGHTNGEGASDPTGELFAELFDPTPFDGTEDLYLQQLDGLED